MTVHVALLRAVKRRRKECGHGGLADLLTIAVIERPLGTRGPGRNWNTVRKIDALARA